MRSTARPRETKRVPRPIEASEKRVLHFVQRSALFKQTRGNFEKVSPSFATMGLKKEKQSTKKNNDENGGLDDVDEYGYSLEFITEKYASLAAQTSGQIVLVHVSKKRDDDLGVKIVGCKIPKVNAAFVAEIAKKSPAEKAKKLKVGGKFVSFCFPPFSLVRFFTIPFG